MGEQTREAPRRRPPSGEKKDGTPAPRRAPRIHAQEKTWADEPVPIPDDDGPPKDDGIRRLPPPGSRDTQSRAKAENSANRAAQQHSDTDQSWPRNPAGKPLAKIEYAASELIPTGQYANVSVGPGRITAFIDLDRDLEDGEGYFEPRERDVLVKAVNELAELIEHDVIAIQRNIVLDSLQEQSKNGA